MFDSKNILIHWGVKGMKWGVRKEKELKGRSSTTNKKSKTSTKLASVEEQRRTAANLMQAKYGSKESSLKASKELTKPKKKIDGKKAALIALGVVGTVGVTALAIDMSRNPGRYTQIAMRIMHKLGKVNELSYDQMFSGPTNSSSTPEQFRKFSKIFDRFNNMSDYYNVMQNDARAEEVLRRYPGFDLNPGDLMHRLAGDAQDAFLGKDYAYLNIRASDNQRYQALYKATIGGQANEVYQHIFKAKSALKIPSGNDVISAFKKIYSEMDLDPTRNYEFLSTAAGKDPKGDTFKNMFFDVQKIIKSSSYNDDPVLSRLVSELKAQGFSGMPDFADYGRSTLSPIVLFDPDSLLGKVSSYILDDDTVAKAIANAIPNPFEDL